MTAVRPLSALRSWLPSLWRLRRVVRVPVVYYGTDATMHRRDTSGTAVLVLRRLPASHPDPSLPFVERVVAHDPSGPAPDAAFTGSLAAVAAWAEGQERLPADAAVSWELLSSTDGSRLRAAGASYGAALAIGIAYLFGLTGSARRRLSGRAIASAAVRPDGLLSGVGGVDEKSAAIPPDFASFLVTPDDRSQAVGSAPAHLTVTTVRSVPEAITQSRLRRSRGVAWLAGLLAATLISAVVVDRQLDAAEQDTRRDIAVRAAGVAELATVSQPDRAGLLAVAAQRLLPGDPRVDRALLRIGNVDARLAAVLPGAGAGVTALSYSTDGEALAVAAGTGVTVWRIDSGKPRHLWSGTLPGRASAVTFAGYDRTVVGADESGNVLTWARDSTGGPGQPLGQVGGPVAALAAAPDGGTVAAAVTGKGALVWDLARRTPGRIVLAGPQVTSLVFTDNTTLVAGQDRPAAGNTLVAVALADDHRRDVLIETKRLFGSAVTALTVDPAHRWLYSGHLHGEVRRWNAATLREPRLLDVGDPVGGLAATREHGLMVATTGLLLGGTVDPRASGSTVAPWNPVTRKRITSAFGGADFEGLTSVVTADTRTGLTAIGSEGGSVTLWRPLTEPAEGDGINAMATDPTATDTVLVLRDDSRLQRYRPASGTLEDLSAATAGVYGVSLATRPDGQQIAVGYSGGRVELRTAPLTAPGRILQAGGPGENIISLAYSSDGHLLATGSWDGAVTVWDTATARMLWRDRGSPRAITAVAFTAGDSTVLIGTADGRLRARAVAGAPGAPDLITVTPKFPPYLVHPTRHGMLVGQADGTVTYADAELRLGTRLRFDPEGAAMVAAELPSADLLLIGTDDVRGILVDATTGTELYRFTTADTDSRAVRAVAFTGDGQYAVIGSMGGFLGTAALDPAELTRRICAYVGRGLTPADTGDATEITRRVDALC
ncbi:WD40 repeat domain-containing protein [Actinoplanes awajinensis]|uniref:Uncharacterized protein n=1 Tax=Actinoplanes awajinensis subsp. mycoplanecinus TaxID=135947 RepID=A0A101JM68_9ACTN|nr:hypothetical protein [Actinoplanes awajinensis]KUL29438.1 hypothetical protein ADL15_27870 [Actinoplanes awajinensis subsp. mycoplanecinus]